MKVPGGRVGMAAVVALLALVPTWARAGEAAGRAAPAGAASDRQVSEPKLPVADVMTRALKLALEAQVLTIAEGSLQSGQVTTAYVPLQAEMIPMTTRPGRSAPERTWARAEYRYHASLGGASRTMLRLKAEIRAWAADPAADGGAPVPASTIASSGYLERQFLQSFREAVVSVNHLFPDDEPEEEDTAKARTSGAEATGVDAVIEVAR